MSVGLPEALELAAGALPSEADAIRPANGDPTRLLELLDVAAAARVLAWLLANEPDDGAELAAAWADDPEAGAAPVLAVSEEELPKPGRKALRRVRHQLRSRGLKVPEKKPAGLVATLPPVEQPLDEALLSPLDPRGTRAAFLVTSHPSGGVRMFEILIDEERGVLETRVYNTGRSHVHRFVKSFRQRDEFPAVSAPPDAVRALVKRIAAAQPADRPLPRGFSEWRSHVADPPEGQRTPGETVREELGAPDPERVLLRSAAEQVRAGALGPWPPAAEVLHPLAEKLGEAARGQVIVPGAQRREQLDSVLVEALDELFAEPFGGQTAARFEETAYWHWKRGNEEDAGVCLATARAFREASPRENPVAKAMIEAVLAPVLAKLEEEIQAEESGSRPVGSQTGGVGR